MILSEPTQRSKLRLMSTKVPRGVKVVDMHATVDGVCTDEVVTEWVNINCRPRKSWDVLQRSCRGVHLEEGRTKVIDEMHQLVQSV